jgi:hypothetical protein
MDSASSSSGAVTFANANRGARRVDTSPSSVSVDGVRPVGIFLPSLIDQGIGDSS